jgi:predicted rRNA methylase YqxC with S4 and FtsJ domains
MIFFILLQTIICVESQYIEDRSEKEMLDLVTKLVQDQNCAVQLISNTFEVGSTALSLIGNLQDAMVPAAISTALQDTRGNRQCHLNVIITTSNQFVTSLDFRQKVIIF